MRRLAFRKLPGGWYVWLLVLPTPSVGIGGRTLAATTRLSTGCALRGRGCSLNRLGWCFDFLRLCVVILRDGGHWPAYFARGIPTLQGFLQCNLKLAVPKVLAISAVIPFASLGNIDGLGFTTGGNTCEKKCKNPQKKFHFHSTRVRSACIQLLSASLNCDLNLIKEIRTYIY